MAAYTVMQQGNTYAHTKTNYGTVIPSIFFKTPKTIIMKRCKINFAKLNDAQLLAFAWAIYVNMNGNDSFPTPDPTMPNFLDQIESFQSALSAAADRSRNAVALKNAQRPIIVTMLRNFALYVNATSKGNLVMLVSSGFPVIKDASPTHVTQPAIESLKQGMEPGSILVTLGDTGGGDSFIYQVTIDPVTETSEWKSFGSKRKKYVLTNLEEGKKYWVRVTAIGSNNQEVVSEEVAVFVSQRSMAQAA